MIHHSDCGVHYACSAASAAFLVSVAGVPVMRIRLPSGIETAPQRLVTMRLHGITPAAELLGLSHSTLSEWVARRMLDVDDEGDDDEN